MDNKYILITAHGTCELERKVNECLDSYAPLGGPVAYGVELVQAMVKRVVVSFEYGVRERVAPDLELPSGWDHEPTN